MDPTPLTAAGASLPDTGELIVQNGKQSGVRKALKPPLTLIGRASGCDVRLNIDGINALHCAIVQTPEGLVVRDLGSKKGTFINGQAITWHTLQENDLLTVGPFRFRVRPPRAAAGQGTRQYLLHELERLQVEKEALRIQAAAVAAQQAALSEQEARLEQQQRERQRQHEQLVGHLDQKREKILELQDQVREARALLQHERQTLEEQRAEVARQLGLQRREADALHEKARKEHTRLVELRRRLRQRWRKQCEAERVAVERLRDQVERRGRELDEAVERLQRDREDLARQHLALQGEAAASKRELEAGWYLLRQQRKHWQQSRVREEAELQRQRRELVQRTAAVVCCERELAASRRQWEEIRLDLERELEGLNNRVRNQRIKMLEQEQQAVRLRNVLQPSGSQSAPAEGLAIEAVAIPAAPTPQTLPASVETQLECVERAASEVAEQRRHVAQQLEHLLLLEQTWQQSRCRAIEDLEEIADQFSRREQGLEERVRAVEATECVLRQQQEQVIQQRQHLEGWQGRLVVRESAWEGDSQRLLARVTAGEMQVQRQLGVLGQLRQRWAERWKQKLEVLRTEQERCHGLREQYLSLWEECVNRQSALEQEQRAVAEHALALEQYRLECLGPSANTAEVEERLERWRHRLAGQWAGAERKLAQEREAVVAELAQLRLRAQQMQQQSLELKQREEEIADRRAGWEQEQVVAASVQEKVRQELQCLQEQQRYDREQIGVLSDEVERLARILLEEDGVLPADNDPMLLPFKPPLAA
jgi:myosin protein heavy chain